MSEPRSTDELLDKLDIQKRALHSSCQAYDAGERWEAERIATVVSTLLHDGGRNSRSLLGQLGLKNDISYISSSRGFRNEHMMPHETARGDLSPPTPLIVINMHAGGVDFVPICAAGLGESWFRKLAFCKWYEEPIFKTAAGRVLSRKNLIHSLRSQDGGAHIDPLLRDEEYKALKYDADARLRVDGRPIPAAHYATMRQIGWEVQASIAPT